MLEINDFNAIRISLASPDDVHAWSHGEVTKPETINYRTLKPERDGLFCERIFGPTKDWECYCGKYKRVRYKGVVCDKCGVEVTRSKVRRDRMGHITLASPVSHIWFVKGTPSRLGLLIDISPRNLERVIYFAAYIVVEVDEEKRQELRERIQEDFAEKRDKVQRQDEDKRLHFDRQRQDLDAMKLDQINLRERLEKEYQAKLNELEEEAQKLHDQLEELLGRPADEDVFFRGEPLLEEGEMINERVFDLLEESIDRIKETLDADHSRNINDAELIATDATHEKKEYELDQEEERHQELQRREIDVLTHEEKEKLDLLENLKERRVLNEKEFNDYRLLRDMAPGLFRADMGAGAIREIVSTVDLDKLANDLQEEIQNSNGQRRKRATKRMRVVEKFRKSGNRPEWMILMVLPVIPPDLRPMVQLDGGRFATSDLNDLYRRVINRNNRLKRLMELSAPEIIVRNEKRMLQEAVDALIDNGRRGRAVSGKGKHRLKSLSDMLKGKQGRFRQNLLGKRVDYSGRSVIVVGPNLQLHQCGLPKKMALELFKPFVMRRLVEKGFAHNIKSAKRIVERVRPEVWDVLEEIIKDYLVLLNRAPSLHRLSIQAFEAKLIEGSAIQLHPLVCAAFNADFDGDQMAVHVPLSRRAQEEARTRMLSTYNLLSPAHGEPIITPSQDIVLGCYYLTMALESTEDNRVWRGKKFESPDEAMLAYDKGVVDIQEIISVIMTEDDLKQFDYAECSRYHSQKTLEMLQALEYWDPPSDHEEASGNGTIEKLFRGQNLRVKSLWGRPKRAVLVETTVGRLIFNYALLPPLRYCNELVAKKGLRELIAECYKFYTDPKNIPPEHLDEVRQQLTRQHGDKLEEDRSDQEVARLFGSEMTAMQADMIKRLGFRYATRGGMTIGINDIEVPKAKYDIISEAEQRVADVEKQYRRGTLTPDERYRVIVEIWQKVTKKVTEAVRENLTPSSPVSMMAISGARGNINQISQMAGMRGLMSDPTGRIIELPIKANFREGLSVLEYFVSTHGGRKGLADTALRTADAGYLTRRLVDVAQDVIVTIEDCGTEEGVWIHQVDDGEVMEELENRIVGRTLVIPIVNKETGEILVDKNQEIDEILAKHMVRNLDVSSVCVRSPLSCQSEHGICRMCYGRNLATGKLVEVGEAVGIVAAQSIGEPGTQLTLRTFHTGGVASADDITQGLPRVQEIFEARSPKGKALLAEVDGRATIIKDDDGLRRVTISSLDVYTDEYVVPAHYVVLVDHGAEVSEGDILAESNVADSNEMPITAHMSGMVSLEDNRLVISLEDREEREFVVPHTARLSIEDGAKVAAGQKLTEGSADPQELLLLKGKEAVQRYLVNEAQKVYRSQGVNINDKHIEVIVRQMLRRVRIEEPGDTDWLPNELIEAFEFKRKNEEIVSEGGDPAIATTVLLGITKASLNTDSFLSAASFQETTRVLTEASIDGSVDYLRGLKENVVIGKLIPAGTGIEKSYETKMRDLPPGDLALILTSSNGHEEPREQEQEDKPINEEVDRAKRFMGIGDVDGEEVVGTPESAENKEIDIDAAQLAEAFAMLRENEKKDEQADANELLNALRKDSKHT